MPILMYEGGAVGHLQHLYDDRSLTFVEIKKILKSASSGKLKEASEKLDGLNVVFTWDATNDELKVARNAGNIKQGGLDAEALAAKFEGRGTLSEAFVGAFEVLEGALGSLPDDVKTQVFGPAGDVWYSMEVIYSKNPNVINYDGNHIVFHGWPVFRLTEDGEVEKDVGIGAKVLAKYVDSMQAAVQQRNWRVHGPAVVRFEKMADGSTVSNAEARIDEALDDVGVADGVTVEEYLKAYVQANVADVLNLRPDVKEMVIDRIVGVEGAPNLTAIKKSIKNDKTRERVATAIKGSEKTLVAAIAPIEHAINDFAVELLNGLKSTLIDDNDAEVMRLRAAVSSAIDAIRSSGDETSMAVLQRQMTKLQSVENITSAIEGVVFIYKGKAYKFTGSFAAPNQILGIFRYGKRGSKVAPTAEVRATYGSLKAYLRETLRRVRV